MSDVSGTPFLKMSGSGNDFVFFDVRALRSHEFADPALIRRLCARGTGVGADGVVLLERSERAPYGMRYFNADGTLASLCGNATLCAARLGTELGIVSQEDAASGFRFETGVGLVEARMVGGLPEIDLTRPEGLREDVSQDVGLAIGERRSGYVEIGVPHVVILCDDAETAAVMERGRVLRAHAAFPHGANVNFISRGASGWRYRTYERGVENETLACGTGAAACAVLLEAWHEAPASVRLRTSSGSDLEVSLPEAPTAAPRLKGPARLVFWGQLRDA
jgi:diaminopimelate epimerase